MEYSNPVTTPAVSFTSLTPWCFSDHQALYTSLLWFPADETATLKKSG